MKILIVHLLRLGDFLQIAPVLEGLAEKYNDPRIDVLTFEPLKMLQPMIPRVNQWWTLDRNELQAGLGQAEIPLLTSFDILREQLNKINLEDYDLIVNLTQTEFAGWITGYLTANEKLGLSYDSLGRAHFHSPWFRYLNRFAQAPSENIFNYTDLFWQACELNGRQKKWPLRVTPSGLNELASLNLQARPLLTLQVMTSDAKKNWDLKSWRETVRLLRLRQPSWQIVVLGAPNEQESVEAVAAGIDAKVALFSLEGALALLERSDVLITGDTSIKHLAAATDVRVIELSLGSADLNRTGTYTNDALILQPRLACAPCKPSGDCTQPAHLCANLLTPQTVVQATELFIQRRWSELQRRARETQSISYYRTHHLETGYWFAGDLNTQSAFATVDRWIDRSSWRFLLNGEDQRPLSEVGTEGVRLHNELLKVFAGASGAPLLAHLDFREKALSADVEACTQWRQDIGRSNLNDLRTKQNQAVEDARLAGIQVKLIRSLKSRLMETL